MNILYLTLPIIFALANRIRGAEIYLWKIPMHTTIKIILPILLAFLAHMTTPEPFRFTTLAVIMIVAYKLGELWGTGKWIGSIVQNLTVWFDDDQDGDGEGRKSGILFLTNLFVNEKKHFLWHCRLALAIRGVYWWAPVLLVFYLMESITGAEFGLASLVLGITFTISCDLARVIDVRDEWIIPNFMDGPDVKWELSELIYGFIQGIVFMMLMW